jgi:hypothetical protein
VGLDFASLKIFDPATTFDFMSYCGTKWVSPYTYERLLRCYRSRAAARVDSPFLSSEREVINVSLTIHRDGRVRFDDPILASTHTSRLREGDPTPYLMELHGDDGVLEAVRIVRTDPNRTDDDAFEDFDAAVPMHPLGKRLVVTSVGKILDSYELAPDVPIIDLKTTTEAGSVLLEWTAYSGDRPVEVLVRYSADRGSTWRLVGRGGSQSRCVVPMVDLPESEAGVFEAVAFSRGRIARSRSAEMRVDGGDTQALISSPTPEGTFTQGQDVYLLGAGRAPGGATPSGELQWTSDIDGLLGHGEQLVVYSLTPGRHRLTLSACNGSGGVVSASVVISVQRKNVSR